MALISEIICYNSDKIAKLATVVLIVLFIGPQWTTAWHATFKSLAFIGPSIVANVF